MMHPGPSRTRAHWAVTTIAVVVLTVFRAAPAHARADGIADADVLSVAASTEWAPAADLPAALSIATASSILVLDAQTGQPLIARSPQVRRPVASTIKLLTVLAALDTLTSGEQVTVGAEVGLGGAGVGLKEGDTWSVDELVAATLVRSGNDAAMALAAEAGGSVEGFVAMMRRMAAELGLEGVRIETPTGFDDMNLLSARDLSVIARAALSSAMVRSTAALPTVDLPSGAGLSNRNVLVGVDPRVTGLKTGFTTLAGYCVIVSRRFEDTELLAVVLGSADEESRFDEAVAALDWTEANWTHLRLAPVQPRYPGGAVDVLGAPGAVWLPGPSASAAELTASLDDAGGTQAWTLHRPAGELVRRTLPTRTGTEPGLIGQRLVARTYATMRQVHARDLWPVAGASGSDVG